MNRLFLFLYLFFFAFMGKAQKITLEHSFNTNKNFGLVTETWNMLSSPEKCIKYTVWDSQSIKIYNLDYSLYKSININLPEGVVPIINFSSIRLFNDDNLIEFILTYSNNGTTYSRLYNENGIIISEFNDYVYPFITKNGNLKLYSLISSGNIYSVNKDISSKQKSNINETKSAYPNPAIAKITLPYRLDSGEQTVMHIYSLTGQLLKAIQIDYNFDKIELDVSDFNAGEYIYEYKGISNKFIVK